MKKIISHVLIMCMVFTMLSVNFLTVSADITSSSLAYIKAETMTTSNTNKATGTASGRGPFLSNGEYNVTLNTMNQWSAAPDEIKTKYTQPQVSLSLVNTSDVKSSYDGFENLQIGSKVLKITQDTGCAIMRITDLLDASAVSVGDVIKFSFDIYPASPKNGQKGAIDNSIESIRMRLSSRTKQTGTNKDMQFSPELELRTNRWNRAEYVFTVSDKDSASAKELHGIRLDVSASGDITKEAAYTSVFASEMYFDNFHIEKLATSEDTVTVSVESSGKGEAFGGKSIKTGTPLTLTALADEDYEFEGWYTDGMWLSDETSYIVYPTKDTTYIAKFKEESAFTTDVMVSGEEILREAVYTADKGTFSDRDVDGGYEFSKSKAYVSTQAGNDSITYTLSEDVKNTIAENDLIMTSVIAKSNSATGSAVITLMGANGTVLSTLEYFIPGQWTKINVPLVTGTEPLSEIKVFLGNMAQNIEIASIELCDYTPYTDKLDFIRRSGMYVLEPFESVMLKDPGDTPVMGKAIDLLVRENYIYVIGGSGNRGYLMIGDISDKSKITKVSTLEGLGQVRQVDITSDNKYILVTGRHNGVTIVDVSDVKNPYIKGYYDSVEFATGICVSENYMYVANRQYGVEIVDISDIENPKQLSIVRCGEAQSCKVIDGYLYAGVWGECCVRIYDVRQPSEPKYLGIANLNGRGDGFSVAKSKDGTKTYLYAATGQHIKGASSSGLYTEPKYGMGNGMDIFDITNPESPKWLSTVKVDGRYFYSAVDYWEAAFSRGDNGKEYAYLISIFNGVYIYDVTDPSKPIRLVHITIPVKSDSPNFTNLVANDKNIFQFDQRKNVQNSPVSSIAAVDGVLYLAGTYTDVHMYSNDNIIYEEDDIGDTSSFIEKDNGTFYKIPDDNYGLTNFKYYKPNGQVYYALTHGDYIFSACGNDGIHVLDKDLNLVKKYETDRAVSHLQVIGDILYSAENQSGLKFYQISGATLTPIGTAYVSADNNPVKGVQVSPNGKWAVIQNGRLQFEIINVSDINAPLKYGTYNSSGHLYYRNLMNGFVDNRYIMCYSNPGTNCHSIIDFGIDCESDTPIVKRFNNTNLAMTGGHAAYKDKAIAVNSGKIIVYNPADYMAEDITALPSSGYTTKSGVVGKPTVYKDVLMLSERMEGDIYFIDIKDISNPKIINSIKIAGNPDLMTATDKYVLIPAGYQGLMKFDTDMFEEMPVVSVTTKVSDDGYSGTAIFTEIPEKEGGFSAVAFVCAYNENGRLLGMSKVNTITFSSSDESKEVSARIEKITGAKEYTFFIWNSMKSMKPYVPNRVIYKEYTLPGGGVELLDNDKLINGQWTVPEENGLKTVKDGVINLKVTTLPSKDTGVTVSFKEDLSGMFKDGDIGLMTFKARVLSGTGYFKGVVEAGAENGWKKSLFEETTLTTGYWSECYLPFTASADISHAAIRFGGQIQEIEIKDFKLINYGNEVALSDLPSTIK